MNKSVFENNLPSLLDKFDYKYEKLSAEIISIKLPLLCSIRISHKDERISFTPFFGKVNRTRAIWVEFIAFLFLSFTISIQTNVIGSHELFLLAFLIIGSTWEVFRYILTESCITRLQLLLKNE